MEESIEFADVVSVSMRRVKSGEIVDINDHSVFGLQGSWYAEVSCDKYILSIQDRNRNWSKYSIYIQK